MTTAGYPSAPDPAVEWQGAKRRYDLVKEAVLALMVVTALAIGLSVVFSSPDVKPVTIAQWATADPSDFLATAVSELDGTSGVATYGPPYTHVAGAGQNIIGHVSIERALGVQIPIDTARAFVLGPLSIPAQTNPVLAAALRRYDAATKARKQGWTSAFATAVARGRVALRVRRDPARFGPVAPMMGQLLQMARSGGLDGALLSNGHFFETNYTKPILFLSDGSYLENLAAKQHLLGSQWGMMNETGNYPGQPWLWLPAYLYQVSPFATSHSVDAEVWGIMALLSLALVLVPWLPGVRSLPRWLPVYRLIWRDYYRVTEARDASRGSRPAARPSGSR